MFVFEPWIAEAEWSNMGCGGQASEYDCVLALGQTAANAAFQGHWDTWITQADIAQMQSYGLNTIRIPVGYWMREDIVYADSEHFPQGGLTYLERLCGWASDAGFYIIIDLHGAPGAQYARNPDNGQVGKHMRMFHPSSI
jgi:aryl-phospho-beta-D-glucosidase BglC (GH1 family)